MREELKEILWWWLLCLGIGLSTIPFILLFLFILDLTRIFL